MPHMFFLSDVRLEEIPDSGHGVSRSCSQRLSFLTKVLMNMMCVHRCPDYSLVPRVHMCPDYCLVPRVHRCPDYHLVPRVHRCADYRLVPLPLRDSASNVPKFKVKPHVTVFFFTLLLVHEAFYLHFTR